MDTNDIELYRLFENRQKKFNYCLMLQKKEQRIFVPLCHLKGKVIFKQLPEFDPSCHLTPNSRDSKYKQAPIYHRQCFCGRDYWQTKLEGIETLNNV